MCVQAGPPGELPLLHRVLGAVTACMGHPSSSVVRQHAGQIFLLLYNNIPATAGEGTGSGAGSGAGAGKGVVVVSPALMIEEVLLPSLLDGGENWQKQEVRCGHAHDRWRGA